MVVGDAWDPPAKLREIIQVFDPAVEALMACYKANVADHPAAGAASSSNRKQAAMTARTEETVTRVCGPAVPGVRVGEASIPPQRPTTKGVWLSALSVQETSE